MSYTQGTIRWRGSPRPILPAKLEPVPALDDVYESIASTLRGDPMPLVFTGDVGCGKTTLMAEIDFWIRTKTPRVRYLPTYQGWLVDEPTWWTTADEYLDDVKAGWSFAKMYAGHWTSGYSAEGIAAQVPILFLDDLGAERDLDFARSELDRLIRARHSVRLPTWITCNLAPDEIAERYGERIASRLRETNEIIHVSGSDRREPPRRRERRR